MKIQKSNDLVLGIDISFTAPGLALMRGKDLIESHQLKEGKIKDSIGERLTAIRQYLDYMYGFDNYTNPPPRCRESEMEFIPDYLSIEKISVGKTSFNTAKKMAYVEGVVFMFAQWNDFPTAEWTAKGARALVLGKGYGNTKKDEVGEIVRAVYGQDLSLDETDAIVVALAGQLHTGILKESPLAL